MTGQKNSWGIVGGGVLGLELARRLGEDGDQVTVFEAGSEPGGLAATWQIGGVRWDKHYHVILPTDTRLVSLINELGIGNELTWRRSSTGLFADDTLYSVSSTKEFLALPSLRLIDKLRLGVTMLYASRINNWQRLERISAARWLARWSGENAYRSFWRPLLRSKLGDNADQASAAFIWAIMKRLYRARTSGAKVEKLGYVGTGYGRILDALLVAATESGGVVHTNAAVERVSPQPGGGAEVLLTSGERHSFDNVVVTTPAAVTAAIVPDLTPVEKDKLGRILYQGIVCTSLILDRPLGGYYVTNITDDGFAFTGVIEMTALVDPATFDGKTLVYLPRYTTADDPAWQWTDAEVIERCVESLQRIYPDLSRDDIVEAKVSRVRYVLAVSVVDHSHLIPPVQTSVPGVAIVSSAQILHGTLNVDETLGVIEAAMPQLRTMAGRSNEVLT